MPCTTKNNQLKNYCYQYPRPALTVDIILFNFIEGKLSTLLIQRGNDPFKGAWAFPGGFVDEGETAEKAAGRELKEETNLENVTLCQLFTDSELDRDPRGRTVSVVYYGFVPFGVTNQQAGDDAAEARWFPLNTIPDLAFDHHLLINTAVDLLKKLVLNEGFGYQILPKEFELLQLMEMYYTILGNDKQVKQLIKELIKKDLVGMVNADNSICRFNKAKIMAIKDLGWIMQ